MIRRPLCTAMFASLLALAALPTRAAEMQYRGTNQNLEEARSLVGKARFEEALPELLTAEQLPGNTNRHLADIYALRATALLGLGATEEHKQDAANTLFLLWHIDPQGTSLASASLPAKELAQEVRKSRTIVLHDRLVTVRTGQPIRIRARLSGAPDGTSLFVRYRTEPENDGNDLAQLATLVDPEEFVRVQLEPAGGAFENYLRPGVGGVPADGDHVLRYYIEAVGPDGRLLDSNGSIRLPIRVQISQTRAEGAGVGGADMILATLDEGGVAAHPPPPPRPPTPWYQRWEIIGPVGGAIVAGVVIGIVAGTYHRPEPTPTSGSGSLGLVNMP